RIQKSARLRIHTQLTINHHAQRVSEISGEAQHGAWKRAAWFACDQSSCALVECFNKWARSTCPSNGDSFSTHPGRETAAREAELSYAIYPRPNRVSFELAGATRRNYWPHPPDGAGEGMGGELCRERQDFLSRICTEGRGIG